MTAQVKSKVRVTIKSEIPELKDKLMNMEQIIVQPSTTWLELLRYYNIPVDAARHQIKSSRNCSYLDDQIQQTALLFLRGTLRVQIVGLQKSRVRVSNLLKPGRPQGLNSLIRNGPKTSTPTTPRAGPAHLSFFTASPIVKGPGFRVPQARGLIVTPAPVAGASNGTQIRVASTAISNGQRVASTAISNGQRVQSTAISNGQRVQSTAISNGQKVQSPAISNGQLHGELNLNSSTGALGQEQRVPEDPIVGGPVGFVRSPTYAESQASQDSQPEEPYFNEEKRSLLESFTRARNEDFADMLKEIKKLKGTNEQSRYRWQRKTPLLAALMFNWADRHQKK